MVIDWDSFALAIPQTECQLQEITVRREHQVIIKTMEGGLRRE